MSSINIHIVIVETSDIIYEGISAIICKVGKQCSISKLDNIAEIQQINLRRPVDIVIINPVLIQANLKLFHAVKKELSIAKWIGLVYSFFDQQMLSLLHDNIYINDSPNTISNRIQNAINSSNELESDLKQEVLSDRETDVLKLLVEGNANKEIADKLNISTHTVITHRKNISQKTGIKSVSGLTIYAVIKKIISINSFTD